jgi:hypothetical protein
MAAVLTLIGLLRMTNLRELLGRRVTP